MRAVQSAHAGGGKWPRLPGSVRHTIRGNMEARKSIAAQTLGRANFFLDYAEAYAPSDRRAFEHFLEAAIVYGRSVTFHLQKEFSKYSGFDDWYREKQEEMGKDPLFRFFLDKRNYILKEGPVSIQKTIAVTISETIVVSDFVEVQVIRGKPWYKRGPKILLEDLRAPLLQKYRRWKYERELARRRKIRNAQQQTEVSEILHFEEPEWRSRPATDLGREYLRKLTAVVNEAEMRFLT